MSKILFTNEQVNELSFNPYVRKVTEKSIQYTPEFKIHYIEQYLLGIGPTEIFREAGFDKAVIGEKRIKTASERWRKLYNEHGELGFTNPSKRGKPLMRKLSDKEVIERQNAEIKFLKAEVELLKKLEQKERRLERKNRSIVKSEVFFLISEIINKYSLNRMVSYLCEIAGVSKSGYYRYLNTVPAREKREEKDEEARDIILVAINYKGYKKGSRSIKMVLEGKFNITYNRKRIQRIMRKYDIVCPIRRRNPYKQMCKKTAEHRSCKNVLNRKFNDYKPREVLLTDITYLKYDERKTAYLSTVLDLATKEILAYNLSKKIDLELVTNTFDKLIKDYIEILPKGTMIHSDQGWHYTNPKFQKYLKNYNIIQSMSRKGNCWDNAPQESFFGHFKDEVNISDCKNFNELLLEINKYMDYYNNHRYQWNLKKMTPVNYRNHLLAS